jgi:hypothetical protein
MPRRTVLAIPLPADVAKGWAAARVENGPVLENGEAMLVISASRRRAQKPAPDEEPDEDEPQPIVKWMEHYPVPQVATTPTFDSPPQVSHARDTEPDPESARVLASLAAVETSEPSAVVEEPGEWLDAFESTGS